MFSAIADGFSVLDSTLLTYNGDLNKVILYSKIKDGRVRKIGAGAFYNHKTINEVIIGDGIEEIGDAAFAHANNLKYMYIPKSVKVCHPRAFANCNGLSRIIVDRKLTKTGYDNLKSSCIRGEGGLYILSAPHEEIEGLAQIYRGLSELVKPACKISSDMRRLFLKKIAAGQTNNLKKTNMTNEEMLAFEKRFGLFEQSMSIPLNKTAKAEIESKALVEKLKLDAIEPYNEASDIKNDSIVKKRKEPIIDEVIVVSFKPEDTYQKGDEVIVRFIFDIGRYFWQSTRKIALKGKNYYVYRREFLSSDSKHPFIRRDVGALNDKYQEVDGDTEKMVYAKYLLASML